MDYYQLYGEDPVGTYSVLRTDDEGRLVWRLEFRDMECPNCGKIDEEAAVSRYLTSDFRVTSMRDARKDVVLLMIDRLHLVSRRFVQVMEQEGISGAKLLPLPSEDRFMLFIPERVPGRFELSSLEAKFPVDLLAFAHARVAARRAQQGSPPQPNSPASASPDSGRQIATIPEPGLKGTPDNRCVACGRHFATYGSIKSVSVTPPADPLRFFTPSFNHESRGGNRFAVLCSEVVARLLLKHQLTGFRLCAMDSNVQLRRSRGK